MANFYFFAPIQSESVALLQDSQMAVAENYLFAPKSRSEELRPNQEVYTCMGPLVSPVDTHFLIGHLHYYTASDFE